ncbi:2461_t:CDS:1 [Funneliformis mosseae]|uniref:2461_t:CDS:1 n=1 Tax=Funneliformis mosseae TaxID=27381 RepID=A0A9N9IDL2_FUNMO|nr:2461_t:CDS:1 [Funneliformis mosseae]
MKIMQKQSSNHPSEYVKNMKKLSKLAGFDHQNSIVFSILIREIKALEKKISNYYFRLKKLERYVNCIEEQTGKELTDFSESSLFESEVKEIVASECSLFEGIKVKCIKTLTES